MKIREYKMENISFKCTELECEKTGIKLQKIDMIHKPFTTELYLVDGGKSYYILEPIFEVIKKLIV
jgi:hypothetical protein